MISDIQSRHAYKTAKAPYPPGGGGLESIGITELSE